MSTAPSAPLPVNEVMAICSIDSGVGAMANSEIDSNATEQALLYPSTIVNGCNPFSSNRPASSNNSALSRIVPVTPSPQEFSCDSAIPTSICPAGCFTISSATILAPSLVTAVRPSVLLKSILSNPRGPYVERKISASPLATAMSFSWTAVPLVTLVSSRRITTGGLPEPSSPMIGSAVAALKKAS